MFVPSTITTMAKVRQKGIARKKVPADVRKVWLSVRKKLGAERMCAMLLIEEDLGTTTTRNAIEIGTATQEVMDKITQWCKKQEAA